MPGVTLIGPISRDVIHIPAQRERTQPGGAVYYAGMALRRLDASVEIITRLAETDKEPLTRELRAAGAIANVLPSAHTTGFINSYSEDMAWRRQSVSGIAAPLSMQDLPPLNTKWIYLGPLLQSDMSVKLIRAIADSGRHSIALDAQGFVRRADNGKVMAADWPEKASILPCIDILKADSAEAALLTGHAQAEHAARALCAYGIGHALVTLDGAGAIVCHGGALLRIPACRPAGKAWPMVDSTGCGDTFLAAYLASIMAGETPRAAGRFAAAAAALKLTGFGPLRSSREEVRELAARAFY